MRTVDFYFDPISPYVWLATLELPRIAEAGLEVRCVPILFAGVLKALGTRGPAEVPAKRDYVFKDAKRCAQRLGAAYVGPPAHPFIPLKALRVCTALEVVGNRRKLAAALTDAAWGQGRDLTDDAVVSSVCESVGLDGQALLEAARTDDVKLLLRQATDAAIARGVFGVPTFFLDDEMFFGADRIDALLAAHRERGS